MNVRSLPCGKGGTSGISEAAKEAPLVLSIVVPVYNEAHTVGKVVDELLSAAEAASVSVELIVVDDGSTDGTPEAVAALSGPIRVIRNLKRMGSGRARDIGSREAVGEWIGWIDGDGTYRASDLFRMLRHTGGFDQVVGVRVVDYGRLRLIRSLVKRFNCCFASVLWGQCIQDLNSGLRLFQRDSLKEIVGELPNGFSCTSTATLAALNRGHIVAELPIDYRSRPEGCLSKFHPVFDTFRLWRVIIRQRLRRGRLRQERLARASNRPFLSASPSGVAAEK